MMYRRNGSLVSCEPCRVAKVRCDHEKPVCSRCRDRGAPEKCFYHPAPMTRGKTEFRPYRVPGPSCPNSGRKRPSQAKRKHEPNAAICERPPGYLGFFSTLSLCPSPDAATTSRPFVQRPLVHHGDLSSQIAVVERSLRNLVALSDQVVTMIIEYFNGTHYSIIPRPLVVPPVIAFFQGLRKSDQEAELAKCLATVKENLRTSFPIIQPNSSKRDFVQSFTGDNIRLEFVALTFVVAGAATMYTDTKPPFDEMAFGMEMYTACRVCLQICDSYNQVNDITIWARFINCHLSSVPLGNASEPAYQVFNESIAELFMMGFHRLVSSPPNVPFFILETRKRIFATAVARDKDTSTIFGRPPRIDSNFCDMILPSDLDDEEILLDERELCKAFAQLDADGWKPTTGANRGIRQPGLIRLRYRLALLHEDILRLSLANRTPSFSSRLHEVYQDYQHALDSIPQHYRYHGGIWADTSPHLCVALLVNHLTYLYSGFILERMLVRNTEMSIASLLDTSTRLLSGVLDFIQHQNCNPELQEKYTFMFLYYGLPGAGTLATELHLSSQTGMPIPVLTPVSQIIRNLSVLLAYFERKKFPDRPDFHICVQISKVIGAMLDDTLNRGLPSSGTVNDHEHQQVTQQRPLEGVGSRLEVGADWGLGPIPPLPDSMTSQNFLNWFDELVWDYPAGGVSMNDTVNSL